MDLGEDRYGGLLAKLVLGKFSSETIGGRTAAWVMVGVEMLISPFALGLVGLPCSISLESISAMG